MAVNATEVLYLTSGLFKAVPSKAILTDLVKFNGNIEGLAASLGTSPYAVNAFPFSNAEKAKTLAENLLGSTVADKAAAVTALEGILNANGGNVGIAAAAGIRAILSDAAFADAKAQLENRVKVAAAYVDSNKGNEISTSVLDAVTKDAATVTAAIASLSGTTGGNEAGADRVLTTAQDILTGTAGNDNFRAVAGANTGNQDQTTLNSSDIIDGAAGTNDTLIVNLVNGGAAANYGGGARIKNIETLKLGTNNNATFDYNVNQGQNEITDVTTIVADQINTGETLTIRNLVRDAADKALPTLSWINDSTAVNGLAGTVNAAYRAAAVSGTDDEQAINLTNVRAGTLNINAGIEKAVVASTGSSTNSIATIDSITGTNTTLKEVVINAEATAALGEGRIISTAAGTRGLEVARTPANDNTQHVSFVNVGSAVTKVDASGSKGNVNVAFTDTATAVANTFIGGEGNDQVVVNGGNDNLSGGKGNDTFIFGQTNSSSNGTFFNNSDTIDGGEGTDTIQFDYGNGNVIIQTSEWLNSKGVDAIDLRGQNNRVQLDDAFVARADAGSFEVITNKIVQNDSTTSVADEANSRHQIDLTTVTASRAVKVTGGEGRETVIVTDALNGVQTISGGNGLDALVVQNGATLTGQDLQNVSGINVFNLVKTSANAQSFQIDLTADFLTKAIDANAAAGTSKNTANAFRIVTDTTDTNAATISGVQTLAAGDSVTITVDTTGLTTVDAINIRDLIASNATITVRNTAGTTLLAAANGAVTTNTGIFAGVTGNNYTYTDLTTNPIAGVGTPVASGQASTGGGGGAAPVAGNTFNLTANTAILSTTANSGATPTTGFLTANSDTVNATNMLANTTVIQDATVGDSDILNILANAAQGAPIIQNMETINLTSYGASLSFASITGNTTLNVVGGSTATTLTNLSDAKVINVGAATNGILSAGLLSATATTDAITVNLAGTTTGFGITTSNAIDTVNVNLSANSSLSGGVNLAAATGTLAFNIGGTGNATLGAMTWNGNTQLVNAAGLAGGLTYTAVAADTVQGGTGADVLSVAANVISSLNGNNGDDSFTVTGGALTANNSIAGGAGTDTLNLVSLAGAAHAFTNVSGIESIVVTQGAAGAGLTTLTLGNTTADSTLTINASALTTAGYTLSTGTGAYAANTNTTQTANVYKLNVTGGANADYLAGGQLADTLTGGAGADTIAGGRGADVIDVGASTTTNDRIWLNAGAGATGGDSGVFAAPATNTISTAAFDVITGMGVGDTIQLNSASYTGNAGAAAGLIANGVAVANTLVGLAVADNSIMQVRGTYSAATNTFVGSATGADTMMVLDTDATVGTTAYEAVVLVGYVAASVTGIGDNAGLITLA